MTNQLLIPSNLLSLDKSLHKYLTSSNFLPNNIWKITFSPCSHYLAIPKQDIYGYDYIIIIYCSNWNTNNTTDELYVYDEYLCSSSICSLTFGQQIIKSNFFNKNILLKQYQTNLKVKHRFDLTKNLLLAVGLADGKINIWNIDTGELTLILTDHQSAVCGLAFTTYTMQLVSCSHDTTIKFWNLLDDGNMYRTIDKWTHVINTVKWSPDETLLCAVGPYGLVVLYDTITWKEIFAFNGHLHTVIDCAFSSDSALLATASFDTYVLLWSTITGELLKRFSHKTPPLLKIYAGGDNGSFIRSIGFTKYDQILITACDDNNIRWFSVKSTYDTNSIFEQIQNNVLSIAIASNGKTMAVGTRTGEVHLCSTLLINTPPSLKNFCRILINCYYGMKRNEIINLNISKHLINYLLYKDIQIK